MDGKNEAKFDFIQIMGAGSTHEDKISHFVYIILGTHILWESKSILAITIFILN
jgi:hypothetical protein